MKQGCETSAMDLQEELIKKQKRDLKMLVKTHMMTQQEVIDELSMTNSNFHKVLESGKITAFHEVRVKKTTYRFFYRDEVEEYKNALNFMRNYKKGIYKLK